MFELIPYLLFNVKTNDKKIKRRLIIETLKYKNIENHEIYLEKNFNSCNYFYAIDTFFWKALIDENKDIPDYIDNSRIGDEIIVITEEENFYNEENEEKMKNNEKNKKDGNKEMKKEKNKENKNEEKKENKSEEKNKEEKKENKNEEKNKEDKKENKNEEKNKEDKKEDNNKNEEKNKEEKKQDNKENKVEEIITKNGKLKKDLKYKEDFIILCDELYNIIKNNYSINFEIKLIKIKTLYLETNKKKEEKKNINKEEEKKEEKEKKEKKN